MTKESGINFIFSGIGGILSNKTGNCDGCRRNIREGFLLSTWGHSEHSNQCLKDFTGLKKLPEVIALCRGCGHNFMNRFGEEFECRICICSDILTLALSCIKAKDQIGKEFYKMIKEGKSHGEALKEVCSTIEAALFPTRKRHIEERRMKKKESEEIGEVEQEMLLEARRKWELRRIAEEKRVLQTETQVPEYAIEERESMINEINDSLEKPKKKKLFQKILSAIGVSGALVGGWVAMVIQFILYAMVAAWGLGIVIYGISLIVHKEVLLGLATIFIFAPIGTSISYLILELILGLIFGIVFGVGTGVYYLTKAIGRLFSQKKSPSQRSIKSDEYSPFDGYVDGIKVDLTDEEVKEAIEFGKKIKESGKDASQFWHFGSVTGYKECGSIGTKFWSLAELGFYSAKNMKAPDRADIEKILNTKELEICILTYGDWVYFAQHYRIVLEQGQKVIRPVNVKTGVPTLVPKTRLFNTSIWAYFAFSDIDLKAKTTIVLVKDGGESRFEVDFSRHK